MHYLVCLYYTKSDSKHWTTSIIANLWRLLTYTLMHLFTYPWVLISFWDITQTVCCYIQVMFNLRNAWFPKFPKTTRRINWDNLQRITKFYQLSWDGSNLPKCWGLHTLETMSLILVQTSSRWHNYFLENAYFEDFRGRISYWKISMW